MARARNIKPGLYKNDELARCSVMARFIFPGLWMLAASDGRLEDRPNRIKAELLPYDSANMDNLLDELAEHGFIIRYTAKGTKCIEITAFGKHQNPHCKEPASGLPGPDESDTSTEPAPNQPSASSVRAPGDVSSGPAESLLLNPESGIPESSARPDASGFDMFWKAWPKKLAKDDARKAWKRLAPSAELLETILRDVARKRLSAEWLEENGKYIVHPATYINGRRWEDEGVDLPKVKGAASNESPEVKFRRESTRLQQEENRKRDEMLAREKAEQEAKAELVVAPVPDDVPF